MNTQKFDGYADQYDSWFVANEPVFLSELKLVKESIESVKHDNTLSVGCGSGLFESTLKNDGIEVQDCIEPSADMAKIAKNRGLHVKVTTVENADLKENFYDLIYFNGSSSYIVDLEEPYKKCYNALKENGHLIIIDVPKESAYGLMYLLAKNVGEYTHIDLQGVTPTLPYPMELVKSANWHTIEYKKYALIKSGFSEDLSFKQTLCNNPCYTDKIVEDVREGYREGGYVAIIARKK